jgi:membrane-bound ClpP family serine protease
MAGNLLLPIILQLLGVTVIIAEFILPSMGLLTVAALGLFGYSLYAIFTRVSTMTGIVFVVVDICLVPVLVIVGMKLLATSPVTLRSSLSGSAGSRSQPPEWEELVGAAGAAVTDLHPAGSALINRKRYDVVSQGSYIGKGTELVVVSVEGNRIVVKEQAHKNEAAVTPEK